MVSDWNCLLKIFACFLYCNNQVHRKFLITLCLFRVCWVIQSVAPPVPSSDGAISEWRKQIDENGSRCGLWQVLSRHLPGGTGHNHVKRQSVRRLESEPRAFPTGDIRESESNTTSGTDIAQDNRPLVTFVLAELWFSYRTLCLVTLLNTKRNLLYISNQSVPRCKHFPSQL
jgi:hypothetical protein